MAGTPPKKPTIIKYFRAGLYTRRSALFAPLRVVGVQVVVMNDALIDGQDMELLDTYQLQRRPGFSRFCSQQLAGGEIVNAFYGHRSATGAILPLFDSNQRLAQFSSSAITTLWTKGNTAQAFTLMIGAQLYITAGFANGQKRFNTLDSTLHNIGIPAPAAMPTVAAPTAVNATFWQPNTAYLFNGTHGAVLIDSNGNVQEARINAGASGTAPPNWSLQFATGTADGAQVWLNLGPPHSWAPNTTAAVLVGIIGAVIIDSNGNIQQCTSNGTSGAAAPAWSTTIGNNTVDGTINWTCMSNLGPQTVFSGYQYMSVYSTQAPTTAGGYYHRSDGSPVTYSTGPVFGTYGPVISGAFSTNTDVGSVDVYRITDGGSVFKYAFSVVNNTAGGTWTHTDNVTDATLLPQQLTIPLGTTLLNDPPPGQTGTHSPSGDAISYTAEWQGRSWGISNSSSGCKVYFTAGPDINNGDPYACWPPANALTYPGQGIALTPTSAGLMLVWLNDCVKIVAGGPQTLSYYPDDLLDGFGISSPNCVWKKDDTIYALSTTGQVCKITKDAKDELSVYVADLVQQFPENASYLTMHENGLDKGLFIGNGSNTVMRYGLNSSAWSPVYKPVGGIGALASIETTLGNYTLCAARATAAGWILGRDLTTYQDDGQNYSACFATIGSIVLSEPLEPLVPVYYVAGYFAAGGQIPTVSVMPNEISASSGPGFVTIFNPQDEPSLGSTPSSTLMAKQWNLYDAPALKTSLLMHHLQVKISFPAENFPSTIFGIALKHDRSDE
ncbi:MAG TPA: hypothetical protein VHW72_01280 [Candidatus Angelobacter sp.]|jgi:uncharacterized protein (DUF1330 family)|nr:hypothetical protein [Candidatus Angelobacter sp.]